MTMADSEGREGVFASYYEGGQQLHMADAIDLASEKEDTADRPMNPAEEFAQFVIDQMGKGELPPWAKPWDTSRMPFPCN